MKRYFILMAIILGMITPSTSAQDATLRPALYNASTSNLKKKVAVYVTGDVESGYKKVIGSKLVTGITRSDSYSAVERTADFLAEMAKEQDYQLSGAVSDNQIAKLGHQFGVNYVLVADVSEVFETIFISARMIDVQTAQITKSTEADGIVGSMDGLNKLSENVVLELLGAQTFAEDDVKLVGSFSTARALSDCRSESGYHIATKEEIENIVENYRLTGKKQLSFPIYAGISQTSVYRTQLFTVETFSRKGKLKDTKTVNRSYFEIQLSCTFIQEDGTSSIKNFSHINDDISFYLSYYNKTNGYSIHDARYEKYQTGYDLRDMSSNPSLTPGYVYMIKDK